MHPKTKFPRTLAISVARELLAAINQSCERVILAGSLRRRKPEVGDIELLYIPLFTTVRDGLFDTKQVSQVDIALDSLLQARVIEKRRNALGSEIWGGKNKLARHIASGIPVDLFAATHENWFNYLVCRTGSAENNIRIADAAQAKQWKWHPYAAGFTDHNGDQVPVRSEQDVFHHAGLPYLQPWER